MNTLTLKIADALKQELPGEKSHRKMLPPGRMLKVASEYRNTTKQSSVLLLLFSKNNRLYVYLIKRPEHMRFHAGQIALPGGRIEKGETAVTTALRETYEEIGIKKEQIKILGKLSEFYVEVSRFIIYPVVGWLHEESELKINRNEVEKLIVFPLDIFKPPFCKVEMDTVTGKTTVPCVKFENEIIWGATAMILAEFTDILSGNKIT